MYQDLIWIESAEPFWYIL